MPHGQDIDTLLDLDGVIIEQAGGCWTKFEVRRISQPAEEIPHGIRYRHSTDEGIPYEFVNGHQLLKDFWFEVDKTLDALGLGEELS
jgi:hypothetical protein